MVQGIRTLTGEPAAAKDARFAIVAARFNEWIVERLIEGATDALRSHGVPEANVVVLRVPGAFEIPLACKRMAASGKVNGVIALGCIIRGATPHFDYVASAAAQGCEEAALATGVPVAFGVLTTDNVEQATERAGAKLGNKGAEAALAALEMVALARSVDREGF
jgi:6,7-dimethyl-8-ribityllumazine synthase